MGISDAEVKVYCDGERCDEHDFLGLTPLAGGGWDDRNITVKKLESLGWTVDGDRHYCESCASDMAD